LGASIRRIHWAHPPFDPFTGWRPNPACTCDIRASLCQGRAGSIRLVLVDSGASGETRRIGRYVTGAGLLRFDDNIGGLRGRLRLARAERQDETKMLRRAKPGSAPYVSG
jgi:hypothetical protein